MHFGIVHDGVSPSPCPISPDIWLDYIRSETRLPGGDVTRVGHLHWRAMRTLSGVHTADFVAKYSILQLAT